MERIQKRFRGEGVMGVETKELLELFRRRISLIENSGWDVSKYSIPQLNELADTFEDYSDTYVDNLTDEDTKWLFLLVEVDFLEQHAFAIERIAYSKIKQKMIDKIRGRGNNVKS